MKIVVFKYRIVKRLYLFPFFATYLFDLVKELP